MTKGIPLPEAIRQRLLESMGPVGFEDLSAHLSRDALFIVAPGLSLLDCGVAVAMDDVSKVEQWIARGELRKPSRAERSSWPTEHGRRWVSVVVQPFVLVQDAPSEIEA